MDLKERHNLLNVYAEEIDDQDNEIRIHLAFNRQSDEPNDYGLINRYDFEIEKKEFAVIMKQLNKDAKHLGVT